LGCAGGDFTEYWTLALSIQDLYHKFNARFDGYNITTFISIKRCINLKTQIG